MRKSICVAILFIFIVGLTACGKSHPVNKVELSDDYVIEHYTEDFPQFTDISSEIYYVAWEGGLFTPIGPTEPGYRAVVVLDDDAEDLNEEYEWTLVEDPQFTLELIDVPQNQEWYTCTQFEQDKFKLVNINYLYFNGIDTVVFDIHTM